MNDSIQNYRNLFQDMIKYLDMVQNEIKDEIDRSNTNGNK